MDTSQLRQVGELSAPYLNARRLIRAVKNPMDKCTIVSIFPIEINEVKHTIEPGRFHVDPGTYEKPSILVVGSSSWWREIDVEQPMLEIPNSSIQVAESVIDDYSRGMLGCDMATAMPGLFYAMGAHTELEVVMKFKDKMKEMRDKQNNWYQILVRLADSLWSRSNNNPLVIWDIMRLAARSLNFNDKAWLKDFQVSEQIRCFACGMMRNPEYPVCPSCKAIDKAHPLAAELRFAE